MKRINPRNLKAGDIVEMHGGVFEVIEDARESQCHRPGTWPLGDLHGPSDTGKARARCISGSVIGYFKPGSEWVFQGNQFASVAVR